MKGDPLPRHAHFPEGSVPSRSPLARQAVGLAAAATVTITTALGIFGVAYAIGGTEATSDNWVGVLVVILLLGGLLTSLAAFSLAALAKIQHEGWALLWFPLSVFPAVLAFLALGEAFWWE
jgi:hypothetical protein